MGATVGKACKSGQVEALPPGPLASTSASLQTQRPPLNMASALGPGGRVAEAAVRMKCGLVGGSTEQLQETALAPLGPFAWRKPKAKS